MDRRRRTVERGQGIVEFAVIFPLLIMSIFVLVDGGLLMGRYGQVNHATNEGARLAALGGDSDEVIARMEGQSRGVLEDLPENCRDNQRQEQICVTWHEGPNGEPVGEVGSSVKVRVHYHYYFITPLGDNVLGFTGMPDHFSVDTCAIVRLERPVQDPDNPGNGTASC